MLTLLRGLPRIGSPAGFLFTVGGDTPVSNLSRLKRRLDALMVAKLDPQQLVPWRLHDLRHTLKTVMHEMRVAKDVRDAVQNHSAGDMDAHYGHYSFEKEKRAALEAWGARIANLTAQRSGTAQVVAFTRQR